MVRGTGRFITLEGVDGAGKSTQLRWLVSHLQAAGREVLATREPGGTPLGEKLRELLLAEPMSLETEALLMFAARHEHVVQVIRPALERGAWVVCDRFTDASFAYQCGGRGMETGRMRQLADWVLGGLRPDLTLVFDAPLEVTMTRLRAGTSSPDRFEREESAFFARVRAAYLAAATAEPERVRIIKATAAPEVINKLVEEEVARLC